MSLENALSAAQQAQAITDMLLEHSDLYIQNETAKYAIYLVMDTLSRLIKEIDDSFARDAALDRVLRKLGISLEVSSDVQQELKTTKPRAASSS
ncbi:MULTISPECIES: hypothetical protein [Methylomonas]|uniref:Uncharacterized protein n=2 Tax=Methylomonas TaxID=416 RepID=A0A140E675_9GAMM|nr:MULTISPECIES: hypothetical protein [Methylomonas]AMK78899.1 hypothetical protein JT25_020830 [Methylomonas denitrificans]OAI02170.1 hypothetical protein A1342_02760 [Methylomonas methanica]TCV78237.1 hypothetical protein EDE11_12411 [Methylomonas methanica]